MIRKNKFPRNHSSYEKMDAFGHTKSQILQGINLFSTNNVVISEFCFWVVYKVHLDGKNNDNEFVTVHVYELIELYILLNLL